MFLINKIHRFTHYNFVQIFLVIFFFLKHCRTKIVKLLKNVPEGLENIKTVFSNSA